MPKTRLISPGSIPNHKLLKNLQLRDSYISNDGGDEGIRVTDAGLVGIGVADPDSALEVLSTSAQLKLSHNADDYATFTVEDTGDLTIATVGDGTLDSDLILDADGDIVFDAAGNSIDIKDTGRLVGSMVWTTTGGAGGLFLKLRAAGVTHNDLILESQGTDADIILDSKTGIMQFQADSDADDLCTLTVAADGATTIATEDSDGAAGHLTLDPDGDLIVSGADVKVDAGKKLYLDGGSDTYIYERGADNIEIVVGDDTMLIFQELGADGNVVAFPANTSAGFVRQTGTYHATSSTVDFRLGNKAYISIEGNVTNLKLTFPENSGNFTLYLRYDGDWTITNYLAYEFDEGAATTANVMWPGGTKPDNTNGGRDVFSFYWDALTQVAFGVASLAFAEPS